MTRLDFADEVYSGVGVCVGAGEEASCRCCGGWEGSLRVGVDATWWQSGVMRTSVSSGVLLGCSNVRDGRKDGQTRMQDRRLQQERDELLVRK